jgi:hypothetical protein
MQWLMALHSHTSIILITRNLPSYSPPLLCFTNYAISLISSFKLIAIFSSISTTVIVIIILPSTPRSPSCFFSLEVYLPTVCVPCISYLPHVCHKSHLRHTS